MIWKLAILHFQFLEVWQQLVRLTPTSISKTSQTVWVLGFSTSGIANGSETISVVPAAGNSIYDAADNAAATSQSNNTAALNEKVVPIITVRPLTAQTLRLPLPLLRMFTARQCVLVIWKLATLHSQFLEVWQQSVGTPTSIIEDFSVRLGSWTLARQCQRMALKPLPLSQRLITQFMMRLTMRRRRPNPITRPH